mgnify:CR=1 FL=1
MPEDPWPFTALDWARLPGHVMLRYGSLDATATDPASVAHWQPIMILGSTFTAGQIDVYPEAQALLPSAIGTTTFGTHPVDVSLFNWLLVQIADQDGTNPGAVSDVALGGTL